ncbi:zinc finger protein 750 [Homo sapiens]|nr:zinc finger protein 750 [Homo sapiens]KAI4052445.1 zinc finger protein 750 [Homo sapiens]
MSPRAGSAATGSPGRPSPTDFMQTSQTCEGLYDLSNKAASSALGRLYPPEQSLTAFRPVKKSTECLPAQAAETTAESPVSLNVVNGDPPAPTGSASLVSEAAPSSPDDSSGMGPLNLSKKSEINLAATHEPTYQGSPQAETASFSELQDLPLNLSVKDPCNTQAPRPAFPGRPRAAEPAAAVPQKTGTEGSEDGPSHPETKPGSLDGDGAPPTGPGEEAPDACAVDSSEEQKQTAAVALCQLAAYSPRNIRVGDGDAAAPEPACRQDTPTLSSMESQEAQCDLRPKGQKRTSLRDAGKSQQGAKKAKLQDTARVFTLRRRARVS